LTRVPALPKIAFGMICGEPSHCDFELDMQQYSVAVGPSEGKRLSDYAKFHVDKACAIWSPNSDHYAAESDRQIRRITLIAPLLKPYAVLLR
jgi:hypothetical protein